MLGVEGVVPRVVRASSSHVASPAHVSRARTARHEWGQRELANGSCNTPRLSDARAARIARDQVKSGSRPVKVSMLERHPIKRSPGSRQERDRLVKTACQECSVACGLVASVKDGRIVDVQGDEDDAVSRGRLCARGTSFVQGITSPERRSTTGRGASISSPSGSAR